MRNRNYRKYICQEERANQSSFGKCCYIACLEPKNRFPSIEVFWVKKLIEDVVLKSVMIGEGLGGACGTVVETFPYNIIILLHRSVLMYNV